MSNDNTADEMLGGRELLENVDQKAKELMN
jgi:hypothetical protein